MSRSEDTSNDSQFGNTGLESMEHTPSSSDAQRRNPSLLAPTSSEAAANEPTASTSAARQSHPQSSAPLSRSGRSPTPTPSNASGATSPPPRLKRRGSSYVRSRLSASDTDEVEDLTDNPRRFMKRQSSHQRHSRPPPSDRGIAEEEHDDYSEGEGGTEELSEGSDHEITLRDRQFVLNQTHPFGMPLWKPALYKKSRSAVRDANSALHSTPSSDIYLSFGNVMWTLLFGWWLSLVSFVLFIILYFTPCGGRQYARVLRELSYYILWPFGKYVELAEDEWYDVQEDHSNNILGDFEHGIGTSGAPESDGEEHDTLLGRRSDVGDLRRYNRRKDGCGRMFSKFVFYFWFYTVIAPLYMLVSCLCWFMVFTIPMAKLTFVLTRHLRRHPLSLHFKPGPFESSTSSQNSLILLCTYKAVGLQYYKYTYDGINIIFINLFPIVFFTIIDYYVFVEHLGRDGHFLFRREFLFVMSLASVIPLSYFIGMAVASISAQSSAGMGAVINATFGSIIEIILYAIALKKDKGLIMEGSIIGSLIAGITLMPGVSMVSGAFKRKEQKFNAKSAGVTSTMLILAIIGAFTPTLFYQVYGKFEIQCKPCNDHLPSNGHACQKCSYQDTNVLEDPFYKNKVRPLMYFCASILVLSYVIGLWFTLRTHAALVWATSHQNEPEQGRNPPLRRWPIQLLQQILPQLTNPGISSERQQGIPLPPHPQSQQLQQHQEQQQHFIPHVRPMSAPVPPTHMQDLHSFAQMAEHFNLSMEPVPAIRHAHEPEEEEAEVGGHDSPNWSKFKSGVVLLGCTALYSVIAEILISNVEVFTKKGASEKFLGLTLFALVPNITEFMNAVAFAIYGNIALSMEIGSAYALQVCLLQIPTMVAFSAWYPQKNPTMQNTFTLVFPKWDVFAVVFSVFLLTYTYIEGKSNYFKGSILILSYLVLMAGFYYAPIMSISINS